jgi:CBS domain-containing protein
MKKEVIVKEAMKMKPVIVAPTMSVLKAVQFMKRHKIGNVIIVENNQPIGILTESDVIKKVVAEEKNPKIVQVSEVMTTPVVVIDPYVSLEEAMKTMGKCNVRRLPVVEDGELIGVITQRDISRMSPVLHEISREWYDITVRDETYWQSRVFSGKCEDCGTLSPRLRTIDGRLLCEDCIDALKYE